MSSLLSEILRWAKFLKYWEQATLDKILAGESFTEKTYQELYGYLLEDAELIKKSNEPRPEIRFFDENKVMAKDIPHSATENRYILLGQTKRKRILFIVFTINIIAD